ncbi:MAG TPA: hypothetical protein PLP25_09245 [Candidatus Limiplasma sp.]|nr:hypothetical protein [Candidatus Limiplasma sp.]HPS82028.1 hypothetical protein [Candidatus Limiplasma sp.]
MAHCKGYSTSRPPPQRSRVKGKALVGRRGEALAGVWGSAPSPTPQRVTSKRANSPQGYEASGNGTLRHS